MKAHARVFLAGATLALVLPILSYAQTTVEAQLEETMRAAILSDPRAAQMSDEEINALAADLADEAQAKGLTYDYLPDTGFIVDGDESSAFEGSAPLAALYIVILGSLLIAWIGIHALRRTHQSAPAPHSDEGPKLA